MNKRHKVFISYYHSDDQEYKDALIKMEEYDYDKGKYVSIFDDYSVHENEIDDANMSDEQIRREIRDNYIKNATVLVLLCGENTRKRKHIDWEIHAAMYHSETNPRMGILVINLPSVSGSGKMLACGKDEEAVMSPHSTWVPASKEIAQLKEDHPFMPERLLSNMSRSDVAISVANWNNICNNTEAIKLLIDKAFERRNTNNYDHSTPLRRKNS